MKIKNFLAKHEDTYGNTYFQLFLDEYMVVEKMWRDEFLAEYGNLNFKTFEIDFDVYIECVIIEFHCESKRNSK